MNASRETDRTKRFIVPMPRVFLEELVSSQTLSKKGLTYLDIINMALMIWPWILYEENDAHARDFFKEMVVEEGIEKDFSYDALMRLLRHLEPVLPKMGICLPGLDNNVIVVGGEAVKLKGNSLLLIVNLEEM